MFGRSRQRGAAMLVMMALIAMGASWMLLTSLNAGTSRTALDRAHNARVMGEAKQALIGWVARNALDSSDQNPGRLPCPEPVQFVGTSCEGIAAPHTCNTEVPSIEASTCTAVGRVPWRTLGIAKPLDAAGEPLWYATSTGWTLTTSASALSINSDSVGQLNVDGNANAAVALIVAPGPALTVSASTNCAARTQQRISTTSPDLRDYLECQNATNPADSTFATAGPSGSFNDQVVQVSTRDLLPQIEAAIAKRIERDIVPTLKSVYAGGEWGLSATDTVFPFAATFADPATATYLGVAGQYQGLFPFSSYRASAVDCMFTGENRCTQTTVSWGSPSAAKTAGTGTLWAMPSCSAITSGDPDYATCSGWYQNGTITITVSDPALDVATALRTFSTSNHYVTVSAYRYVWSGSWSTSEMSPTATAFSRTFNADGTVSFKAAVSLPSISSGDWGWFQINAYRPTFSDHPVLESAGAQVWFYRNKWYRFLYYAVAPAHGANSSSPRNCQDASSNCITVANLAGSNKRAILILAGRSLTNPALRPNGTLSDYVDSADNRDGNTSFTQDKVGPATNDRIIVLDQSS